MTGAADHGHRHGSVEDEMSRAFAAAADALRRAGGRVGQHPGALSADELASISGHASTIAEQRRIIDRALDLADLAERVFGEPGRGLTFLRRPNRRFGDQPPLAVLGHDDGAAAVAEMLHQLDHGIMP